MAINYYVLTLSFVVLKLTLLTARLPHIFNYRGLFSLTKITNCLSNLSIEVATLNVRTI
jgi:hypothetical protein